MGVDNKDIQAILRQRTIGRMQNVYIKNINESQVNALDALTEKFESCNDLATNVLRTIQRER